MTNRTRATRRILVLAGGFAAISLGVLTGCGTSQQPAPTTTTTTTTTTTPPPTSPTAKNLNPTGGNLFTPPVQAPTAPTVAPGQHPGINGVS
jgi:hypothetical protein